MIDLVSKSNSFIHLKEELKNGSSLCIENLSYSMKAALLRFLFFSCEKQKNILIISGGTKEDFLYDDTLFFLKDRLIEFPSWETMPEEKIEPSPDIIGKRMESYYRLISSSHAHIIFANIQSLLQKTPDLDTLLSSFIQLKRKEKIPFQKFIRDIEKLDYKKAAVVADKKEYAVRGGIIDIFPTSSTVPYRVEFLEDEIESIRSFDTASQKSIEKHDFIFISPAKERIFSNEKMQTLLDLLDHPVIVFDDLLSLEDDIVSLKSRLRANSSFFLSFEDFFQKIKNEQKLCLSTKNIEELCPNVKKTNRQKYFENISFDFFDQNFAVKRWFHPFFAIQDFMFMQDPSLSEKILDHLNIFDQIGYKLCFVLATEAEEKSLPDKIPNFQNLKNYEIIKGSLSSGFVITDAQTAVFSSLEILNKHKIRRQKQRSSYHLPTVEFHNLQEGDLVVHTHSGIGKFLGIEKQKNHLGQELEFFVIQYAENSRLYVPLSQSNLISRYIGSRDETPALNILGSNKWQKAKELAQKQIVGFAQELLELYAQRALEGGFVFPKDSEEMSLFEEDFPFPPTLDQLNASNDVKSDMMSPKPMDRLILGDVGYGKTEVAMRAAFKAVFDGKKQAAILVPTTILALQHFESFKERMASFPISIEMVSRLNSKKLNDEILQKTKNGQVDILIGTHRLLSKDVLFKDLGLIIIDEEQRFGVKAKEHLKNLKKGIDCLTLSATPIPRTLYMSLIKIKDMSVISSPPQDRLPIKTIIVQNDDEIIKNALLRELFREGQSFFIHNRVESIYQRSAYIQNLIPQARIDIVHGQMDAEDVDRIFHKFKNQETDILFSTTLIENGIDIPNANTIIVDNADHFGLADLYQLRGRVGRWSRSSYAYFILPKNKEISEISGNRLSALMETGGYGGGMKLAMRDLEIRGAGDILGIKQSGQISAVGFHLYCKLLKRTIEALKDKKEVSFTETKMEFSFTARIPQEYIPDSNLRMEIYYRFGESTHNQQLDNLMQELTDRFGNIPTSIEWLYHLSRIRIFANRHNFTYLKFEKYSLYCEKAKEGKKIPYNRMFPKAITSAKSLEEMTIAILLLLG